MMATKTWDGSDGNFAAGNWSPQGVPRAGIASSSEPGQFTPATDLRRV
jgi:hypothetical protein